MEDVSHHHVYILLEPRVTKRFTLLTAKNSKILGIGILILTVLPDIPTTTAKAATTNL
jgi:hypothetical protein